MFNSFSKFCAASAVALAMTTSAAYADACSGHSHPTGTILGAVGGGLIGNSISKGAGGIIGGAVVGGLAGNAVERSLDCRHHHYYRHARYHRRYYPSHYASNDPTANRNDDHYSMANTH